MKNKFKLGFIFILTIITGLVLIACDNGDDTLDKALANLTVETILGDNESKDKVTLDLELPTKDGDVVITWDSNKPAVITAAGKVTRQDADETVRLTATLSYDGAEEDKHFDLVVLKADGEVDPDEEFTVTFNSDGGTSVASQTVEDGAKATKPANPTKAGFKFLGWFLGEDEFDFDTVITGDITLVAKWEEDEGEEPLTIQEVRTKAKDDIVEARGVVTAIIGNNFFIQDETAGIYIYAGSNADFAELVEVGNKVAVSGKIDIFNNLFQISTITNISLIESNQTIPTSVVIEDIVVEDLLELEGELVTINNAVIKTIPSIGTGAYTVVITLNDKDVQVRVDQHVAEFAELKAMFEGLSVGMKVDLINIPMGRFYNNPQLMVSTTDQIDVHEITDLEKVAIAKDKLDIPTFATIEGLVLPLEGMHGTTITWVSSSPTIITNEGVVTLPEEETKVTLTATIKLGDAESTKEFEITVQPEDFVYPDEAILAYPAGSGTKNMTDDNNAESVGLDSKLFTVLSNKNGGNNHIGLNNAGQIRLYNAGGGNILTLNTVSGLRITRVEFSFGSTVNKAKISLNDNVVHEDDLVSNGTLVFDELNISKIDFQNVGTGQIYILEIKISYYDESVPVVEHTVTFDTDGGNTIDPLAVEEGNKVTQPEDPTKEGFTFLGWFLGDAEFDFETVITEDITLVAKWEVDETIANVSTLAELEAALADEAVLIINLTADINATETIVLSRSNVTIDGKGFKIIRPEATDWVSGDAFVLQVYLADEVVVKDLELVGANGALLVNGAKVSVSGLTLTSQSHGGIEVSKGVNVETNPELTVDGEILHDLVGLPIIWIDGFTENNDFVLNHELETFVPEGKTQLWFIESDVRTITIDFSQTTALTAAGLGLDSNIFEFTVAQNDGTTSVTHNGSDLRLYYHSGGNGGSATFKLEGYIIETIEIYVNATSRRPSMKIVESLDSEIINNQTHEFDEDGYILINGIMDEVTIQNANTTNTQARINTIKITYKAK